MEPSTKERIKSLEVCYQNICEDIREIKEDIGRIEHKIDKVFEVNNKQNEHIAKHSATLEHETKNIYWIMGIVAGVASGVGTALITTLMRR